MLTADTSLQAEATILPPHLRVSGVLSREAPWSRQAVQEVGKEDLCFE